jgi:hypothetical protein
LVLEKIETLVKFFPKGGRKNYDAFKQIRQKFAEFRELP